MKRNVCIGAAIFVLVAGLGVGSVVLEKKAAVQAAGVQAPTFEVDPMWPKPLPFHWVMGMTIGVSADAQDNIWIIHRGGSLEAKETYGNTNPPGADCCVTAPPVLEFDKSGNLIGHWGGPGKGYNWPTRTTELRSITKATCGLAATAAPWIPSFKTPGPATCRKRVSRSLCRQSNPEVHAGWKIFDANRASVQEQRQQRYRESQRPGENVHRPKTNELYVADGYGNRRVIVFDADTGQYKRHWGAYGHKPDDTDLGLYNPDAPIAQQFRNPVHCAQLADDGLLYVCDRVNDRIQVFKPDGTFVKEQIIEKRTLGDGSVWDIAFSRDPEQKYIYLSDGANEKIHILLRDTLQTLTSFGDGGRQPGQFYAVHSIARIQRATSTRRKLIAGSACRSLCTRAWDRSRKKIKGSCGRKSSKQEERTYEAQSLYLRRVRRPDRRTWIRISCPGKEGPSPGSHGDGAHV